MTDETPPPAPNGKFTHVPLEEPIMRGDQAIASLTLRKPSAGELRGLSLQDLLRADVGSIIAVLPRISDPTLTEQEAAALDPASLAECAGAIAGFFLTSGQRAVMAQMMSMNVSPTSP